MKFNENVGISFYHKCLQSREGQADYSDRWTREPEERNVFTYRQFYRRISERLRLFGVAMVPCDTLSKVSAMFGEMIEMFSFMVKNFLQDELYKKERG